jgi:tetratricopeptide (TPR) repeat protein
MESDKRSPSGDVIRQLALRLGCSTAQLMDGKLSEHEDRISLEVAFARLAIEHGEAAEARRRLERVLAEEELPLRRHDEISHQLGVACDRSGDLVAAIRTFLPLFERACSGDTHLLVSQLGLGLCGCYQDAGDLGRAVEVGERALAAAQVQGLSETDDYLRLSATVMWAYVERGDWAHARVLAEGLLADAQMSDGGAGQAALYWNLGTLAAREGRVSTALQLYDQALGRLSELDNTRDFARLRLSVASVLLGDDPPQVARAADLLHRCADDVHDLCSRDEQAEWNWAMAVALLHQGDLEAAEARARRALELSHGAPTTQADALQILGDVLAAQGRNAEAIELTQRALVVMSGAGLSRSTARNWRQIAERLAEPDPALAAEAFRRALDAAGVRDRSVAHRRQVAALRAGSPTSVEHHS